MAIVYSSFSKSTSDFLVPSCSTPVSRRSLSRNRLSCSSASMDSGNELRAKFMEFPYISGPQKDLMLELVSSLETRFESSLQPCTLPPDVQHFSNLVGSAHASINIRSGLPSSQIDFILECWTHCKLPSGGALNITTISAYLKPSTDAPHFLMELIQTSPTSLLLILDLTPRKDLVLHPDYLKTLYEDPQLDRHRQHFQLLPEVRPYVSPSLYIRSILSPAAVQICMDVKAGETANIEDKIQEHVSPVAKELLQFWMDKCACLERHVGEPERRILIERDRIIKTKIMEVDLGSSFQRLFGQEVGDRVVDALMEYYS